MALPTDLFRFLLGFAIGGLLWTLIDLIDFHEARKGRNPS